MSTPIRWRDLIEVHEACRLLPPMSDEELKGLAADIQQQGGEGRILSPIVVWRKSENEPWQLLDGRHRLNAAAMLPNGEALIREAIRLSVHKGPETDPYAYVLSVNLHRRHLTAAQKREIVVALLKADPSKSDRRIAAESGLNRTAVGLERKKLAQEGGVSIPDTRTDTQGRQQPATKPTRNRAELRALRERDGAPPMARAPKPASGAIIENTAAPLQLVSALERVCESVRRRRTDVEQIERSTRLRLARNLVVALEIAPEELAAPAGRGGER